MASSTYAGIEAEFGISQEVAILSVSLFVLGLGSGPMLLGPVSEFIGRRKVGCLRHGGSGRGSEADFLDGGRAVVGLYRELRGLPSFQHPGGFGQ